MGLLDTDKDGDSRLVRPSVDEVRLAIAYAKRQMSAAEVAQKLGRNVTRQAILTWAGSVLIRGVRTGLVIESNLNR